MEKNLTVGDDEKKVVKEWFEELRNIICEEFEKISSCSKKFKWYRKLNDGSLGYWEKYFGVSDMLLRHFKLNLKFFLEAHFL